MPDRIKPRALRTGGTIGIAAPGSPVQREMLLKGAAELERLGYRVRYRDDIFASEGLFAGSHERRTAEFLEMLEDPSVDAIVCARGGYGCNYVAERLLSRPLPAAKIVVGCSDVTTLLGTLWKRAGWITFHGPMAAGDFARGAYDAQSFALATQGAQREWQAGVAQALVPGRAEGLLLGGCLSLLAASLGTPREIDWPDSIVFLEDVGEKAYRLDRLLFHLREAGKFEGVRGIVFGEMKDCPDAEATIRRVLGELKIPMAFGLPSGHTNGGSICLPLGVAARLEDGRLTILEEAVR